MIQEFAGFHTDSDNGFDGFGFAVDMSADGNTILVAAGSNWYNGGYIRMFKRSDSSSSYEQYVSIHFMSLSRISLYSNIIFNTDTVPISLVLVRQNMARMDLQDGQRCPRMPRTSLDAKMTLQAETDCVMY